MTFLHPWALWIGLPAVAAPLVIHFLTRPRPVRMPLSTLQFVREAIHQRRARHRLRDLIILALRTLAVLFLALAVARPQRSGSDRAAPNEVSSGQTVRVVIVDVSQSMAATESGIESIERARTTASRFLRYRPELHANLILASATPTSVFSQPSTNFESLRDALAHCRVRPERLNVARALDVAAAMLAPRSRSDDRQRELVIVSDFQRTNWASADFSRLPEATELRLESVASPLAPPNLAILGGQCGSRSRLDRSLQLAIEVGNFSPTSRTVTVEADLGAKTYRLEGICPARSRSTLTEEIQAGDQTWLWGEAKLLGVEDALMADNVRPLVGRVLPKPLYVLLTRQPAGERPSSSHFLECALVPDAAFAGDAAARLVRLDPAKLNRQALAGASLILLDHPGKLEPEALALLADGLRRGRAILYVTADPVDATNLKRLADVAGSGLQPPVEFMPAPTAGRRENLFLASVRHDDPPFDVFGDHLPAVTGRLRFAGGLISRRLEGGIEDELLATYGDGTASMVLTYAGAGALAVINADLGESDLPKTSAFVPLLQELVDHMLTGNGTTGEAICGQQLVAPLPGQLESPAGLRVVGPQDTSADEGGSLGRLTHEGAGVAWHWPNPDRPGVYRVERDGEPLLCMAVGIAAEESELDRLSQDVLETRLAGSRSLYYHRATGDEEPRDDTWTWFLTLCVICMLGELATLLAFRT